MAKKTFLRIFLFIASCPFRFASILFEYMNCWEIKRDIKMCIELVDKFCGKEVPLIFVRMLIAAEDKRNSIHYGVDPYAMVRAIYVRLVSGKSQGASTIEQQFVRVATGRYEKTISRKFREQMIALSIVRRRPKRDIAIAYLSLAFFGSGLIGIGSVCRKCYSSVDKISYPETIEIISRLKYPEPIKRSDVWLRKHILRNAYIANQLRLMAGQLSWSYLVGQVGSEVKVYSGCRSRC